MKGLIYHTLYGFPEKQNYFLVLGYISIWILFFSQPNTTALLLFWGVCNFALSTGSRLQSEKLIGWEKYELTLPVKQSHIVRAKFLSYFVLLIKNTAGMNILFLCVILFEGAVLFKYAILAILFGIAVALLIGAAVHPLYFMQKSTDSSELMISSIFVVIIVLFLIWITIKTRNASVPWLSYTTATVYVCTSVVLFILSYFLSVSYYKNKQR